jgi:hypothetical protein
MQAPREHEKGSETCQLAARRMRPRACSTLVSVDAGPTLVCSVGQMLMAVTERHSHQRPAWQPEYRDTSLSCLQTPMLICLVITHVRGFCQGPVSSSARSLAACVLPLLSCLFACRPYHEQPRTDADGAPWHKARKSPGHGRHWS